MHVKTVRIDKGAAGVEDMEVDVFARWMCLMEAYHVIETKAEELKVDIDKLMKPIAIERYVSDRYPSMRHDVGVELDQGILV